MDGGAQMPNSSGGEYGPKTARGDVGGADTEGLQCGGPR